MAKLSADDYHDTDHATYLGDDGRLRVDGKIEPTNNEDGFFVTLWESEKSGEL